MVEPGADGGEGGLTRTPGSAGSVTIAPFVLNLVKSLPSPSLLVGLPSTYTLTVSNAGGRTIAAGATVQDKLPANLKYVSSKGSNWTCSAPATPTVGQLVTCTYNATISANSNAAALSIIVQPTAAGTATNQSAVGPTGDAILPALGTCTALNTPAPGCAAPVTSTVFTTPILDLDLQPPTPDLALGNTSVYKLQVTNKGSAAATGATIVSVLPSNLTYNSMVGSGWACTIAAQVLTCKYTGPIGLAGSAPLLSITATPTSTVKIDFKSIVGVLGTAPTSSATTCNAYNAPEQGCAVQTSVLSRPVGGTVYSDTNFNGSRDGAEAGLGLALFVKLAPAPSGVCTSPATATATVDPLTGEYTFSLGSSVSGPYCLILDNNATLTDITPTLPAGYIGTQNPSGIAQITVGKFPVSVQNFGFFKGAKLNGTVFADSGVGAGTANDGIQNGTEPGIAGVSVSVGANVANALTAADGTYSLWIPSGSGSMTLTPATPTGYLASGGVVGTTGGTYTKPSVSATLVDGQTYSGVNFGLVAPPTLVPNGVQSAQAGTSVLYTHTLIANTAGQVTLSLTAADNPSGLGWSQVLYQDSNCNGTLDAGESPVSAALGVTAGQQLCFVVKQFVPAGATPGAQNSVTLNAAFSYTAASPAMSSNVSVTDITSVGPGDALRLNKTVSNVTQVSAAALTAVAKPGDVLQYTLTAVNSGTQSIVATVDAPLKINDVTSSYTTYVAASALCPASLPVGLVCEAATGPAGTQGLVEWVFSGVLTPSSSVSVSYRVTVEP